MAHISDDDLERYAMLTLGEAEIERLEDHLLICPKCRERLDEIERYVAAMRAAAAKIRDSESGG